MARSTRGVSVVGRVLLPFDRRVRDTVEVHIDTVTEGLVRAMVGTTDGERHEGWTVTPATRKTV